MKRFSGFICGVLVTLLVAGLASPALAALTAKTIEVYTGVTLYVDDVKFTPKNALGEEVEILLYNGTTYLPVRAIGEAYGKDIAWDDATKSAYIGYHEAPETQPALADGTYDVYFEKNSAKNGKVSVAGWLDDSDKDYIEFAKEMEADGVKNIIFTDISKDGTLAGPNLEQLSALSKSVKCDITASGGVHNINDIKNLLDMNLYGAIAGRAIYDGTLDLREAVNLTKG